MKTFMTIVAGLVIVYLIMTGLKSTMDKTQARTNQVNQIINSIN